ncbi:MAG: hypothetical protein U0Z53_04210 [Blastocatellia bacterium]
MGLLEIYLKRQTWAEYLNELTDESAAAQIQPAGLTNKALRLNADFNLRLGDRLWKQELQQERLSQTLEEIRLAEFEREARAYRARAERAYLNGWYEEALRDFLEAEKRNYPDYAVHRSIAHICLYHLIDLPRALEYFQKAARYARPLDTEQAAEAHFFAAVVCLLQHETRAAFTHLREAVTLNPELSVARYQMACLAALNGDADEALESLELAIGSDARYFEMAGTDAAFDAIREAVTALLDRMMPPVRARLTEVRQEAEQLQGYVIAQPVEEQIAAVLAQVEEESAGAMTYQTGLRVMEALAQIQQELRSIHDRFYQRYSVDPRDYIRSVAFSRDGRLLAAGFLHGGLQVWEAESGMQLFAHNAHFASVQSVAFSPSNYWLASGSRDRDIKLWEAGTGHEVQTLKGHTSEVRQVAFSPDGQWLVSASHDQTVRLWRVATGREAVTLKGHTMPVTSAIFSPDGSVIASGSWDKSIRLWDVATERVIDRLTGHSKGIASLAISPDGAWLASGGEDATVKLWDLKTGRAAQTFTGHGNSVTSVAFSPDGELLAAGCLGRIVMVWKLSTGEVIKRLRYQNISYNSVAFSPGGQWLALGSRDLQLWLKVILTAEEYAEVKAGSERALRAASEKPERMLPAYLPIDLKRRY